MTTTYYIAIAAVTLLILGVAALNWNRLATWWASVDPETRLKMAQRAVEELVLIAERRYPDADQGMYKFAYVKVQITERFPLLPDYVIDLLIDGAVKALNRAKVKP
jgi:hypothetical protein